MAEFVLSTKDQLSTYFSGLNNDLQDVLQEAAWYRDEHPLDIVGICAFDRQVDAITSEIARASDFFKEHYSD